jgi:hypothetical protein
MPWCQCDKCDGGKSVSPATLFRHRKRTAARLHLGGRRSPGVASPPLMDLDVNRRPEEEDTQDDDNEMMQSDHVRTRTLILSAPAYIVF